ncbi:sialate O-acetylesterase, partial [bacterium]|nr:sialate O-acetylesterase [bacterium]
MRPSLRVYGASVTTRVLSICALVLLAVPASADVALPPILGDHMVLQRETPVRIWGTADVGEDVAVEFARQEKKTTADGEGRWSVTLDPLAA